jgi:hypothetical protein
MITNTHFMEFPNDEVKMTGFDGFDSQSTSRANISG